MNSQNPQDNGEDPGSDNDVMELDPPNQFDFDPQLMEHEIPLEFSGEIEGPVQHQNARHDENDHHNEQLQDAGQENQHPGEIQDEIHESAIPEIPTIGEPSLEAAEEAEESEELAEEDPNTSRLELPNSTHLFTTPLKSLPPLKDIENITTPKSFSVAKDVESSPVVHHKSSHLEDLAEAEDAFDATANDTFASAAEIPSSGSGDLEAAANYIGVAGSSLRNFEPEVIAKLAHRAHQYLGIQSELSFFKLNQEQINQVQLKKHEKFRQKLDKLAATNTSLSSENETMTGEMQKKDELIHDLRIQTSTLSDKVYTLESASKEADSDYSGKLASREHEIFRLNESINKITKSNIDLGQKLSELTKELNEVTNEKFMYKLDLSKATNELSYVKNQKDWYELELKTVQDKYTSLIKKHDLDYLRDSNRVSSLSSQNESLVSLKESLQAQVKELLAKLEKETARAAELDSKSEISKIKFSRELTAKEDLIELINVQLTERSDRISQLERYAEDLKETTTQSIGNLQKEVVEKEDKVALLEEKLRRTEDALDAELHKETELPKLAASAEMIMQTNPLGISLSALYTEFNHMKKELILEKSQKEKLAHQLQHFVQELESKKPAISNYRNQIQFYELSLKEMLGKLESLRLDKLESDKESNRLRTRLSSFETELQSMKQLSKDLGRQLCYYLIHSKIRDGNDDPLTIGERKTIDQILARSGNKDARMETDTDQLISERLVGFANIIELQHKNEELLMAVRLFGKQLEAKEHESNGFESAAIEEAREAILTLQGELDGMSVRLEAVTKERDLMKSLNGAVNGSENSRVEVKLLNDSNSDLKSKVKDTENTLKSLQAQSGEKVKKLTDKLTEVNNSKEELQLKLTSAKHLAELAESRFENTKKNLENARKEIEHTRKEATFWKEQASKQEGLLVSKSNDLRDVERNLAAVSSSSKNLLTEKEVWTAIQKSLKEEITQLKTDKQQLNSFVFNLQSLLKERETSSLDLSNRLSLSIENFQNLQQKLSDKEERILILSSQSEMALKAQNTKLEQVNELSQRLLDARTKLAEKQNLIDSLRTKVSQVPQPTSRASRDIGGPNDLDLGDRLSSEYEDLKNDLKLAESQVAEFSNIAKAAEDALMNATESFDNYKTTSDQTLTSLQLERDDLTREVSTYKTSVEELQKQLHTTETRYMTEVQDLKAKSHEYSLKAGSYDELKNDYESKFATISKDLESQIALNDEIEKKYQYKMSEVDLLNIEFAKQKDDNIKMQQKVDDLSISLQESAQELKTKEDLLSEEKLSKQEELEGARIKIKDLQYQYDIALNQLELRRASPSANDQSSGEDLREVINYLRREKEAAEAKLVVLSDEKNRLKSQIENAASELNASRSQVVRLQTTKMQLDDASKEHSRLLEQLEQLNILRESNTTLRQENKTKLDQIAQLQSEIEALKNSVPVTTVDETAIAVKEQDLRLLKEENDRLKVQLNSNEELKNLMQRFENLKTEFKNKLMAHRTKNKDLEKLLAEATAAVEVTKKELSEAKENAGKSSDSEVVTNLKAQLSKVEASKSESESKFEADFKKLRSQLELEKKSLRGTLQAQFEQRLKNELEKASTGGSDTEIRQQVENEWRAKNETLTKELTAKFEKELDSKVQAKVSEKLASASNEEGRSELTQHYEQQIKTLNEEFEKRLAEEKLKVEKAVDKKYEFKLRVLNRKVEKLEKEQKPLPTKSAEAKGTSPTPLGHQFTENTLSVIRPTVEKPTTPANTGNGKSNAASTNGGNRKRPFVNRAQNANNKRSKE